MGRNSRSKIWPYSRRWQLFDGFSYVQYVDSSGNSLYLMNIMKVEAGRGIAMTRLIRQRYS